MTSPASAAAAAPGRARVFGRTLTTDRPLPGLPAAPPADGGHFRVWILRTDDAHALVPGHREDSAHVGGASWSSGITASLAQGADGAEIVISDTGRFTLHRDGVHVTHDAPRGVNRAAVALDLIGTVLPYALHQDGAWCVHASAVQCADGVVAFVAPRGTGKSTLAVACLAAGCALVADDVVVLQGHAGSVRVTPAGVPVRLRGHTAVAVGAGAGVPDDWGKVRIDGAAAVDEVPLAAIYVLTAVDGEAPVERRPRAARAAALALFTNGKITELLGAAAAGEALARCTMLAAPGVVHDLAVPRDLARLPEVTAALMAWHGGPPRGQAT